MKIHDWQEELALRTPLTMTPGQRARQADEQYGKTINKSARVIQKWRERLGIKSHSAKRGKKQEKREPAKGYLFGYTGPQYVGDTIKVTQAPAPQPTSVVAKSSPEPLPSGSGTISVMVRGMKVEGRPEDLRQLLGVAT
jgi:hypothetical protein